MNKKIFVLLLLLFSSNAYSETLSGPRFGFTYLDSNTTKLVGENFSIISPLITQFGWQFERKFLTTSSGPEGITALVPLVGGVEQGVFLPSISWLTGLRLPNGLEFAVGPNVSLRGGSIAATVGHTSKFGELYLPVNLGLVASKDGVRISFLFGFNSNI
ncbi:MAG: hypothetical protein OEZ43_07365 [Gammaproteobacteria bacterium]|nr:hypothetical protein [Gammaproteobacteria bacterium]